MKTSTLLKWLLLPIFIFSVWAFSEVYNRNENPQVALYNVPELKKNLSFANEVVPTHVVDVWERFDREMIINLNLHSNTTLIIKRAHRYFPVIEPILRKHNIPDDFKYLAVIESGLVNVVSPAGARGVWQFMPQTAKEKGLEVTDSVDERYHLEKSTEAACQYIKEAYNRFGNWTMAAAAYNAGMAGMLRQIDKQKEASYYDLLLNEETSRYVFRILALKEIMRNADRYGFGFAPYELYHPVDFYEIKVDSSVKSLIDFAKSQGVNYKTLKWHNPWLRDTKLENKARKEYVIRLPKEGI